MEEPLKTMQTSGLTFWGVLWIPLYLVLVLLISLLTSRHRSTSANDFLNATRSLPTWAASLSFLAHNCGSIEVIGMSAMAAQYGVQALHFYWIGGIPGMIFLGGVVVPVYLRSGARSLPEYLEFRFGPSLRLLNAVVSMAGTTCLAGGALYALAHVLHVIFGFGVPFGLILAAAVVLAYVLMGGVRATIHTSIFQLLIMIAGLLPLLIKTFPFRMANFASRPERWHLWQNLPALDPHAALDRFGVIFGLGFVISFSYWCTDFVIVQRTLTARDVTSARKVPVLAGFGKLLIAFLIVLPGAALPAYLPSGVHQSFDETIPRLMAKVYGPTLLGLGVAALVASLMAAIAGNVSGFSAAWTEEIYRTRMRPGRSEAHYITVGRWALVACFALAELAALAAGRFGDLMEFLQLVVSLIYAPLFAVVLAAFLSRRTSERRACFAILAGVGAAMVLQLAARTQLVPFGSQMSANFYVALFSFTTSALVCIPPSHWTMSLLSDSPFADRGLLRCSRSFLVMAVLLLLACIAANILWW